jgi:SulP family sulfate permease
VTTGVVASAQAERRSPFPFAIALRRTLANGYTRKMLRADVLAGAVVAIVALPLSMALSIAVGAPPQHGLYTAIVAGFVVALAGGSKHQVTGPTAAFVVVLAPVVARYGVGGLLTAGMMAGVLLVLMGFMRFGKLIEFIPYPVTTGFTTGIATVIATLQLKDCFGLQVTASPESYFGKVAALWGARGSTSAAELGVAVATMALLLGAPKITKRVPAPLVAITVVAALSTLLASRVSWFHVATIGSRFSVHVDGVTYAGIPPLPPMPRLPWGAGGLSFGAVRDLGGAALAIAMLGAIESLLSAVIADATTGKRHDPDAELVALGLGNIVAPFFGGIAATGALARTATNIRAGAVSPIAAATHALFVLAAVLLGSRLVAYVPMASLAALLLLVAWNMSEIGHFIHTVRVAPRSDVLVLVTCFVLTVVFDMVVAVSVGVVLAALLFMRRMSAMTESRLTTVDQNDETRALPPGIAIYEIAGPLFFGAAQRAMRTFDLINDGVKVVVLALGAVPVIDATGLAALEGALSSLEKSNRLVVIAGPLPEPHSVFERAHLDASHDKLFFADDVTAALKLARTLVSGASAPLTPGEARDTTKP